ncbi:MAG: hypothetical protein Q7S63_03175 [bacterium]|nr:hypothetical protein [bacterium]
MIHDEYRLTEEQIAYQEEKRFYDWSLRIPVQLSPVIVVDRRLINHSRGLPDRIKEITDFIIQEHGDLVQKMEVIIHTWELDQNFSSVSFRWTSAQGVFWREFGLHHEVRSEYSLVPGGSYHFRLATA